MPSALDTDLLKQVEQFIYREARLADELDYDEWEALWTDDAIYWVPANNDDIDPTAQMSVLFDNRSRIATRIKQLQTGKRHSQNPPSRLRRLVSNIELLDLSGSDAPDSGSDSDADAGPGGDSDSCDVHVGANFILYESRERGVTMWAGRSEYRLRHTDDGLKMAYKKVLLVNNDRPLNTMSFLI
jgi:benzoate/toluate 1,2-dioxygenase subunit beta